MAFRVEISAQAERDAEAILEWLLSQRTGQAGIDWFLAFDNAFASLAAFPERCPIAPENTRFPFEVRQLLHGRKPHLYRILFTIEADTVYVLHIRHGRRKPVAPSE
jgi:toxin ParE1/3/4